VSNTVFSLLQVVQITDPQDLNTDTILSGNCIIYTLAFVTDISLCLTQLEDCSMLMS
jgi:hypothetical protein